jgi:TIR domain-containing protein
VGKIFLSYRRKHSKADAGRIHDRLLREFGADHLFMDVDNIPLGKDFVQHLTEEVASCDVLLAIIGENWLGDADSSGLRRIDDPHDFVRVEIASALRRDIRVVPILIEGATIPKREALPDDIRALSFRNGLDVRHATFHNDLNRLIRDIKELPEFRLRKRSSVLKWPQRKISQVGDRLSRQLVTGPQVSDEQTPRSAARTEESGRRPAVTLAIWLASSLIGCAIGLAIVFACLVVVFELTGGPNDTVAIKTFSGIMACSIIIYFSIRKWLASAGLWPRALVICIFDATLVISTAFWILYSFERKLNTLTATEWIFLAAAMCASASAIGFFLARMAKPSPGGHGH